MNYKFVSNRFPILWYPALLILMLLLVPMMPVSTAKEKSAKAADKPAVQMPAWIVETSPAIGAIDVDPGLKEVSVTFDRDMDRGMSWTGDAALFPPTDGQPPAHWRDKRTCVFPVKMEKGAYYRLGINASSFRNFRSAQGEPAPCTAIFFATKGASKSIQTRVRVPQVVKLVPENGAVNVDPKARMLRVTFNMPMGGGMSWTRDEEGRVPDPNKDQRPKWSADGKTCVLPVVLEPNQEYALKLNDLHNVNFQSKWGVPLVPVAYKFKTKSE